MSTKPRRLQPVPALRARASYAIPPARSRGQEPMRLHANEGILPEATSDRVQCPERELLRRYPDASELEAQLAASLGIAADRLLVTAGADEALDRVCRAWLDETRAIALPAPGFEMLTRYAELARARIEPYLWLDACFPVDEVVLLAESVDVVAIVTPNNPTGLAIDEESFRRICESTAGKLLLVDLAYVEFADFDPTEIALDFEHVVVVRSLSKSWGIAGLRVGYACGAASAIAVLRAAGSPYSVSGPSIALAESLVQDGAPARTRFASLLRERRSKLSQLLAGSGLRVWESQANFVLCDFGARAGEVHAELMRRGIAVRSFAGREWIGDCLRITCGRDCEEQEALEAALRDVLSMSTAQEQE